MTDSPIKSQPEKLRSTVTTYDSAVADIDDTDIYIDQYLVPKTSFQLCQLKSSTEKSILFCNLDEIQRKTLLKAMEIKEYAEKDFVFKIGEVANNFYIIRSGTFRACDLIKGNIREYYKGDMICESAVIFPYTHKFHMKAITFGSLWYISREEFRQIKLTLVTQKRKLYERYLAEVPLFRQLHTNDFITLADCLEKRSIKKGEFVYKQQSPSDGLYIIEKGIVHECVLDDIGKQVILYKIKKGGYFGERSMITCSPRNTSAIAAIDTVVVFLAVATFERLKGFCKNFAFEEDINELFGSKVNLFNVREIEI